MLATGTLGNCFLSVALVVYSALPGRQVCIYGMALTASCRFLFVYYILLYLP